jgi:DNA-binding LytR/AlgR family response regulator
MSAFTFGVLEKEDLSSNFFVYFLDIESSDLDGFEVFRNTQKQRALRIL